MSTGHFVFITGEIIGIAATLWLTFNWLCLPSEVLSWKEHVLAGIISLFPWAYVPWMVYAIWWLICFTYNTIAHLPYCA